MQKASSQMFDWVLNAPLSCAIFYSIHGHEVREELIYWMQKLPIEQNFAYPWKIIHRSVVLDLCSISFLQGLEIGFRSWFHIKDFQKI